jgi:glycosyltransferase involved in cell wall biosynthesis
MRKTNGLPMVSAIIPNYNHAPYLKQRIDSVLSQTHRDFEVIILDDCSTDNSKEIIETYRGHPKITNIVYNERNSGSTFRQWKKGIDLAIGEWVWIAESDDYCEPNFLASFYQKTLGLKGVDLFFFRSRIVVEGAGAGLQRIDIPEIPLNAQAFVESSMYFDNVLINASAVLFRREQALRKWNGDIFNFKLAGDWFFWVNILKDSKALHCSMPLNFYRKHDISVSSESTKKGLWLKEGVLVQQWIEDNYSIAYLKRKELSRVLYLRFFKELKRMAPSNRRSVFWSVWRKLMLVDKLKSIIRHEVYFIKNKN